MKCAWLFGNSSMHGQDHKQTSKRIVQWELFKYVEVNEGNLEQRIFIQE